MANKPTKPASNKPGSSKPSSGTSKGNNKPGGGRVKPPKFTEEEGKGAGLKFRG